MGYTKDTIKGVTWVGGFRIFTRIFSFVKLAVLARLLSPNEFGSFGLALLVLTLVETITQSGISVFLIQERKNVFKYINSAYFLSVIRGLLIFLFLYLSAFFIAGFFGSLSSVKLIQLISIVALIRGFSNPARVIYLKNLEFRKEIYFSTVVFLVDSIVSIIFAFWLRSPSTLVWGLLAGALAENVMSWIFINIRPKFEFKKEQFGEMFKKGKWFAGFSISDFLFEHGDDFVVGKLLNTNALGIYQAAYKISILPITEISRVFNTVTFPVYSNISGDRKRLLRAFKRITLSILIVIVPFSILLYVYSDDVVSIILGDKWLEVIPVLKILSIFGLIRAFGVSVYPLFSSLKRQNYVAVISFTGVFVMMVTIVPLILEFGILGAGYSVLFASVISIPMTIYYIIKLFT